MRRAILLAVLFSIPLAAACTRKTQVNRVDETRRNSRKGPMPAGPGMRSVSLPVAPMPPIPAGGMGFGGPAEPINEVERQQKFEAALQRAMELLADKKYEEALVALEAARSFGDSEIVQLALERTQQKLDREKAAEQTAADIQAVLDDGRAEDAAKLAADALQSFGDTSNAATFAKLKNQADAIVAVQVGDKTKRLERFRTEYESAKKVNNLRAAALSLEQALQISEDELLKKQYDEIRTTLTAFDQLTAEAGELRKDPGRLEEAIDKLKEAAKLWNTEAIRQQIDDYTLALQNRRERLAIAEFEVRGDIGIPEAGRFIADELLPAFKSRYDLVERSQIEQIALDLKVEKHGVLDDELVRRELGKAAKVRFLVVGSVTPVSGITVQARLVDTETGLIVQTGRIVAANSDELTARLPQLAELLQMNDEEKRAFDEKQAKDAAEVTVLPSPQDDSVPAAPELPADDMAAPAPLIPAQLAAPAFVGLEPDAFDRLPGPPAAGPLGVLPVLPARREAEIRLRSMYVSVELGDNLFRRRRFREALIHFEFCLNLFPEHRELRLRVERCRLLVPPVDVPPPIHRPRLAMLDFLVVGKPAAVPPYLGWWTAQRLAPYFSPTFEVVNRTELFWWIGRLGITPRDLLLDPVARLYLGRALNIRYFLFGHLVETASFNVTTFLVDAEFGYLTSSARIHVRNPLELKLRLAELAWLTKLDPAERIRIEQENLAWEKMLQEIRLHRQNQKYRVGSELARQALKLRPSSVEIRVMLDQMVQLQRSLELKTAREIQLQQRHVDLANRMQRERELVRAVEIARLEAERQSAARADAERRRLAAQREQAFLSITLQARTAWKREQYQRCILLFESALALRPNDEPTIRELALARARAEEAERTAALAAAAVREKALREQRERELAAVAARLEVERRARAEAELAHRRAREDRHRREYDRLMDHAQQLSAKQQYDQAASAVQAAKKIRPSPEADRLLSQLLIETARARAEKRGAEAKAELERQLAAERARREQAEKAAEDSRRQYQSLLAEAQRLLQKQQYTEAIAQFTAARKIHATDATLTGMRQAQAGLKKQKEREAELARANEILKQKSELLKKHLADAQAAFANKQYDESIRLFQEAKKIDPKNETVLIGLTKAEKFREQELALKRRQGEEAQRKASFRTLLESGKQNLAARRYDAAALALTEALRLYPNDAEAKAVYAEALSKVAADANAKAELQRKSAEYQRLMTNGRRAMAAKQYDKALESFVAAKRLMNGDKAAEQFAQDALDAKNAAEKAMFDKTFQQRKAVDLANALAKVRTALAAGKLDEAEAAHKLAAAIDANNAAVKKAHADIAKARNAKSAAEQAARKRQEQFDALIGKARSALAAKRFDEAVQAATQAVQLQPADKPARDLLAQATKGRDESNRAAAAQLQARLKKLVEDANAAILAKKLDDADKLLAEAAKLGPRDAGVIKALAALRQARQAMAASELDAKRRQQAYQKAITAARAALKAKRYDDALKSVSAALQQIPNDKDARALRAQVEAERKSAQMAETRREFAQQLLLTRTALAGKKFDAALKHVENALKLVPNDAEALKLRTAIEKAKGPAPKPKPPAKKKSAA